MSSGRHGWTTASLEAVVRGDTEQDPTPGFALVYSRLHEHLPAAVPFAAPVTTIGREEDNHLSVPEAAVSRHHARVEQRSDGIWVVDAGSTNGTVVNGVRTQAQRLRPHDVVRVGDTIFRYVPRKIYGYTAYRIDGSRVSAARPFRHPVAASSPLIGGYQIDALLDQLTRVASTELSVVVTGESGTGKELVAREVHRLSQRQGAFQAINCAALPANLLESELFGYRRGAFTGATGDKVGLVEAANNGTLFLDEIGDMPIEAQAKLLRVLQEREVMPLGATTPRPVNLRVVCATHRDLDSFVAQGRFRGDLLARLREFSVVLPPLRERLEDLLPLTLHFLQRAGRQDCKLSFPYMLALSHYDWPYNVRELESAVKLSLALAEGNALELRHLPVNVQAALDGHGNSKAPAPRPSPAIVQAPAGPAPSRSQAPPEETLRALLARHRGNIAAVGRELGKERMQIHRWMKRYGIDAALYRS